MKIYNRRARFKYQILEKVEAGVVLLGAEVKSIRAGRADLSQAFARIRDGEIYLVNAYINPWMGSEKYGDLRRERKLLLHKNQIHNWQGKIAGSKLTLVPLAVYMRGNLAKVELALCKNKSKYDKRTLLKKRTVVRDVDREVRGKDY